MKKKKAGLLLLAAALAVLTSCAPMNQTKMVPDSMVTDLTPAFQSGDFDSKVDGLVILVDASSSMAETFETYIKFDIAKAFVRRMNQTMPPISAVSGLRTFGHSQALSRESTRLFYGMAPYDRQEMDKSLASVTPAGGPSPMTAAIKRVARDLDNISGNKALIIISDGKDLTDQPLTAAQNLQEMMGDSLCIYTVMVGDDEKGKLLMEEMARISPCGFMAMAQDINSAGPMADYVSDVFLTKIERTALAPEPKKAPAIEPEPAPEETGLGYHKPEPLLTDLGSIHFAFDRSDLTAEGKAALDQHIQALTDNPDVRVLIGGHTSAMGTDDYNQMLSEKRAATVRDYLIHKGNIPAQKLTAIGYGETKPAMPEASPRKINSKEARANMRVVFEVTQE
jgi:OOP family OmpA-OmpF porin